MIRDSTGADLREPAPRHRDHWRFTDSDGNVHDGREWTLDLLLSP